VAVEKLLISSLGFDERHIIYAALDVKPNHILVVMPENTRQQSLDAYSRLRELLDYLRLDGVISSEKLMVDSTSPWRCAEAILGRVRELDPEKVFMDVGGGVRSLVVCLTLTAMLMAMDQCLVDRLAELYTWAEDVNKPVKVELRPIHGYRSLTDPRAQRRRELLSQAVSGAISVRGDKSARDVAKQLAADGIVRLDESSDELVATEAGRALNELLKYRQERRCA